MRSITVRDVAERAGVSVGTISNALNRPEVVAPETLKHILRAIDEVGYVRNSVARQLRGVPSPAIGLLVLDIDNPFFTAVARGVDAVASTLEHLVILCSSDGGRQREDRQLRLLEEQRVAGVLMTPSGGAPRSSTTGSGLAAPRLSCSTVAVRAATSAVWRWMTLKAVSWRLAT